MRAFATGFQSPTFPFATRSRPEGVQSKTSPSTPSPPVGLAPDPSWSHPRCPDELFRDSWSLLLLSEPCAGAAGPVREPEPPSGADFCCQPLVKGSGAAPAFPPSPPASVGPRAAGGQGQLTSAACPHASCWWGPGQQSLMLPASIIGDRRRRTRRHFRNVPAVPAGPFHQHTVMPGAAPAPEPRDSWPHADPGGRGTKGRDEATGALGAAACSWYGQPKKAAAGRARASVCRGRELAWQLAIGKCEARSCLRDGCRNVLSCSAADRPPAAPCPRAPAGSRSPAAANAAHWRFTVHRAVQRFFKPFLLR